MSNNAEGFAVQGSCLLALITSEGVLGQPRFRVQGDERNGGFVVQGLASTPKADSSL